MNLTLEEINNIVNGTILNPPEKKLKITGVASLELAEENEISIYSDKRFLKQFLDTKAGAVIIAENLIDNDLISKIKKPLIKVKNAQLAFIEILKIIEKEKKHIEEGIHKTAIISKNVQIDQNVNIGAYVVIEENVKIGKNTTILPQCFIGKNTKIGDSCFIYPQVVIREDTEIGSNVIIHSGTVIGSDGFGYVKILETGEHKKIPQVGSVLIEDNVEIGSNVTIDRATTGKTIIGEGTKIDNLVQIAHNVKIGKNCYCG
ncbi:MAG: UDP-3-O-(3-hydroxymyristoyl)glucosamine N-acyltransferase [Endomicrobiia bacterium]